MLEDNATKTVDNSALELLTRLRSGGVSLSKENEQLRFKAPQGLLKKSDIEGLKHFKADILALLQAESEPVTVVTDPESRFEPFPLTDVQAAYLLGRSSAFQYGGVACHIYLELKYPDLNPEKVASVWGQLIERHDMLRATISQQGFQQVQEKAPAVKIDYFDASKLDEGQLASKLQEVRGEMAHRVYDTDRGPLFGIALTKTSQYSMLHFSIEFLIADGASVWYLLGEFEDLYYETDRKLPELNLAFRDYVITEINLKNSTAYYRDRQYWLNRIDQLPAAPDLPLMVNEEAQESPRFTRRLFFLEGENWNAFKTRVQKYGVTTTSAVMAAYSAVLERWSKNKAFCLNMTVLNRLPLHEQVYEIVGDFTSVNMLEVAWSTEDAFMEQAKKLNTQIFSDLDHRLFTGVEVLREVARRKGRDAALMPIVFTSAIGLAHSDNSYKLKGEISGDSISQTPQVFIECQAADTEHGIKLNWDVREGIFPEHMIDDMFQAFEELLMSLANNDAVWENKVSLPLPKYQVEERQQVNGTKAPLPTGLLQTRVFEAIQQKASSTAILDKDGAVSYEELGKKAGAIAKKLNALGCKPQECVAIILKKSADQVAAVLGALSSQAVYVPIDSSQPELRRTAILEQANIRFVLTHSESGIEWPETIQTIEVDKLQPVGVENLQAVGDSNLPAYIIFTSGSTGTPKGVVISHKSALNTIEDINQRYHITGSDKILGLAQLGFDLSVYDIFGLLSVGGTLVFPDTEREADPSHWAQLINEHGITLWNTVPALMQMLVSYLSSEKNIELPTLRKSLLSGDWIPINLPDQIIKLIPSLQVVSLGGATEASIWSIYHEYKALQPEWQSIPYGRPLSNQGFRVLDTAMRDCPVWVTGELFITGDGLAQGYLGNKEMTDASFFVHPEDGVRLYRTGDLGRYLPGGEIEFLGREDSQVKIRGHRIELGEIEATLQKYNGVAAAGVVVDGKEDDRSLLAVIETAQQKETSVEECKSGFQELIQSVNDSSVQPDDYLKCTLNAIAQKISQKDTNQKIRILEIGAKNGNFTARVVESFETKQIDFLVTDNDGDKVTQLQNTFAEQDGLRFTVFDLNGDYRYQGLEPNSFDLVLVSSVGEENENIQHSIKKLTEIISPGGYLLFTANKEGKENSDKWLHLLQENIELHSILHSSDKENSISSNQRLFVATIKTNKVKVNAAELTEFISQHLPAYMIPTHLQIVDALPLTTNGKVDRKTLVKWRPKLIQNHVPGGDASEEMDELETLLAQVWIKSLEVDTLSKTQNIYDMGTASLIMAQIAGNVREMLNESDAWKVDISFDNLLRHMLNYPTIEALAEYIRFKQSEQMGTADPDTLKELTNIDDSETNGVFTNYGGGEEGILRVVFHAGLGTINSYLLLMDHMDKQQLGPVIGVTIKNTDKYCELNPDETVEHVAEDYAKQLADMGKKEVQLIGHCVGGFTAVEVARRLMEKGITVKDLSLIDCLLLPMPVDDDWVFEIIFVSSGGVSMKKCGFGDVSFADIKEALDVIMSENPEKIPYGSVFSIGGTEVLDKVRKLFQKLNTMSMRERFSAYAAAMDNVHGHSMPGEMLEGLFRAYNQSFKAADFKPPAYSGDARFFVAEVAYSFLPPTHEQSLKLWGDVVCGDFQVSKISGDHNTSVEQEPYATELAKLIEEPLLNK